MNNYYEEYVKQSTISCIQTLADKIGYDEDLYEDLIKHSLSELEQIRDGHIIAYNDIKITRARLMVC